jgi:lipopolysaccharide assembly protein A
MRYVYAVLIIVITTTVLLFKIQNISLVTVSMLNMSLTLPASLLIVGVYVLGMLTGSVLWSLLSGLLKAAMRKPE